MDHRTIGNRKRPLRTVAMASLVTLGASLLTLGLSAPAAHGASLGALIVFPANGTANNAPTFITSGLCPAGDLVTLKVFGGSGNGANIPNPANVRSPKNYNGAVDGASYVVGGTHMEIQASQTWSDFATSGTPVLTALNGTYTVRAWCASGDWFDGQVNFVGTDVASATYTSGVTPTPTPTPTVTPTQSVTPSPSPSSVTPTPTPSPTQSSATPTPSQSSSATQRPTITPTPTPTLQPTMTPTPTPTPSRTLTPTPTPIPSTPRPSNSLQPGERLGVLIGEDGTPLPSGALLRVGENVTMSGFGFKPGELLKYSVFSKEIVFGYGYADGNGATLYRFVIPDLGTGMHKLAMSSASQIVVFPFRINNGAVSYSPRPAESGSANPQASATSDGVPSGSDSLAKTGLAPTLVAALFLGLLIAGVGANMSLSGTKKGAKAAQGRGGRHL